MNKKRVRQFIEISIGVLLLDIAYYFFLTPTGLVTGGTMGISIIISDYLPFSPSIFLYIVNGILLVVGLILLGKDFFFKTCYATVLSPTIILIFEQTMSPDFFFKVDVQTPYIVAAIIGGLFTALGLGICFKNQGTTGGMDVIQKIMVKYMKIPYSKTMYLTDGLVILIGGAFVSLGNYDIEMVLYGVMTVILVGYLVDIIVLKAKSRRTAYIVTTKSNEMKEMLFKSIGRGVTECDVRGGYTDENKVMLICTMEKNQAYKLLELVNEVDPDAFAFISATKEVVGNYAT
ncbi:MAG: YitT family protein [Anaeroplasmataceae bacterium]